MCITCGSAYSFASYTGNECQWCPGRPCPPSPHPTSCAYPWHLPVEVGTITGFIVHDKINVLFHTVSTNECAGKGSVKFKSSRYIGPGIVSYPVR